MNRLLGILVFYQAIIYSESLRGSKVRPAGQNEFSFVVSIQIKAEEYSLTKKHLCTGTLISKRHVLTTAHCIHNDEMLEHIEILIGSSDLEACEKYYPKSWITYKRWAEMKNLEIEFEENDLGILTLLTKVKEAHVIPARLSKKKSENLYGLYARTAGWGTSNDNETPLFKQTAFLSILTMEQCEKNYERLTGTKLKLARTYLCSVANPYVLATCGNSGGPLFYKHNKILGINKGFCPRSANPTDMMNIHIGIDYYREFILNVKNNMS